MQLLGGVKKWPFFGRFREFLDLRMDCRGGPTKKFAIRWLRMVKNMSVVFGNTSQRDYVDVVLIRLGARVVSRART